MGKIFISYANEDRALANDVNERLRQSGHDVFFDESNLKPSDAYDRVIQSQIAKSDIMLFLCSEHSLSPGRYTLTELEMAKAVWKAPQGRVLPILLGDTDFGDLPSYLKGLSAYRQKGDPVSEISQMANDLVRQRLRKKRLVWGGIILAASLFAAFAYMAGMQVAGDGSDSNGNPTILATPAPQAPPKPEMDHKLNTLSITNTMIESPRTFDQVKFEVPEYPGLCPGKPFNILNRTDQTVMITMGFAQSGTSMDMGPIAAGDFKTIDAPEEADLGIVILDSDTRNYFYFADVEQFYCQ